MDLTDPTGLALAVADALRREGVLHALYGGLLLAAYGQARETKDADLAVVHADAPATARLLEHHLQLHGTVAFDRCSFEGLLVSRITLIGGDSRGAPGSAYASRALGRSLTSTLRGRPVRVLAPETGALRAS